MASNNILPAAWYISPNHYDNNDLTSSDRQLEHQILPRLLNSTKPSLNVDKPIKHLRTDAGFTLDTMQRFRHP
ncbi:hypothetical protein NOR_03326 [Metarhizium rileyi]|uniref:Uncharacterized protein n=1 Tax=Metarhizium rileyi (strain RCEF 4871) TaxID=1649241 RepID=A0A167FNS9_METRR|nr:hypothetical protein NOR_03326 [Metarhizium rileyi RCEF 4871]TWU78411.1 hypothetical protein ED733_008796 [Metarhizium rileyi]